MPPFHTSPIGPLLSVDARAAGAPAVLDRAEVQAGPQARQDRLGRIVAQ